MDPRTSRRPARAAAALALGVLSLGAAALAASDDGAAGAATTQGCPRMPTKAPAGYKVAVHDDFNFVGLNLKRWFRWAGEPGGDPYGWWVTPKNVAAYGSLWLSGAWVTTGGNPSWSAGGEVTRGIGSKHVQTYGLYEWCMRSEEMAGTETDVLLWPRYNSQWPPEIDLYESDGSSTSFATTIHYGTRQQNYVVQRQVVGHDATKWHVYRALWSPGLVQLSVDGTVVSKITGATVPRLPMRLDLQTQAIVAGATPGTTEVGWVVEYQRAP